MSLRPIGYTSQIQTGEELLNELKKLLTGRLHGNEGPLDYARDPIDVSKTKRQIEALHKKRQDCPLPNIREEAIKRFFETENRCKQTNERYFRNGGLSNDEPCEQVFYLARKIIHHLLGSVPKFCELRPRHSSGAVTRLPKQKATINGKLSMAAGCTRNTINAVRRMAQSCPHWINSPLVIEAASLSCVPKSRSKMRTITVEPMLNVFIQNGVGDYMRQKLRDSGLNLFTQTYNQSLARYGSISGKLATVDLSDASDNISYSLVLDLLPPEWFDFLEQIRSCEFKHEGLVSEFEKFSGQGCGFTFPLQSAIFYALAKACCMVEAVDPVLVNTYGDDIIIPVSAVPLLYKVLSDCGLVVNYDKSFSDGPFRESCGCDYISGVQIRPYYFKNPCSVMELFVAHNFFYRNCDYEICDLIKAHIPQHLHIFGPDDYGDGHLLSDEWVPLPYKRQDGWGGFIFETFSLTTSWFSFKPDQVARVLPCYSIYILDRASESSPQSVRWNTRRKDGKLRAVGFPVGTLDTLNAPYKKICIYILNPFG